MTSRKPQFGVVALLLLCLLLAGSASVGWTGESRRGTSRLRMIVPAYFYPAGAGLREWDRLIEAAPRIPITAIVNPATGPGEKIDPTYTAVLQRARRAGITLVGYVSTSYARRARADVEAHVDRWPTFYPEISGVFFDEQTSSADAIDYCAALYAHTRKKFRRPLVLTNPGTVCAEDYLARPATDIACLFENHSGFDTFQMPPWTKRYEHGRFLALPYQVEGAKQMEAVLWKAMERGFGNVYVTDARLPNPWDRLPSYWAEEVELIRTLNKSSRP